ncbi:MAG: hypothetical protein AB2L14_09605 [Candidatus Xenobiia bacterium LiM19]
MRIVKMLRKMLLCLFLLAVLFTVTAGNAFSMLGMRLSGEMKVDSKGFVYVNVRSDGSLIKFDSTGQFVEEMKPFTFDGRPLKAMLFDIDRQDNFWLISGGKEGLTLYQFSADGKLLKTMKPSGKKPSTDGFAKPIGIGFDCSELPLDYEAQLSIGVNEKFNVPPDYLWKGDSKKLPERYRDYAADADENLYVLISSGSKGSVRKLNREGETVAEWEAEPSPITSVSSLRTITTDVDGNVYIMDSSWEVSSSLENSGSIQKFSPEGKFLFRITKDRNFIQYPQEMAVDREGNIYLLDLGDYISKFDRDGRYLFGWSVVPPQSGQSWKEKQRLEKLAESITDESKVEDLVVALIYGDYLQQHKALKMLTGKGAIIAPQLVQALVRYDSDSDIPYEFNEIFDVWGDDGIEALKKVYHDGSAVVKKKLAAYLGWKKCKEVIPTLREMMKSGDSAERNIAINVLSDFPMDDEMITVMLKKLGTDNEYTAISSLSEQIDTTLPRLIGILKSPAHPLRKKVAAVISDAAKNHHIKDERSLESLRNLVSSKDPFVRKTALLALWKNGDRSLDNAVLRLAETDCTVREEVFDLFSDRKDIKCVPLLVTLIRKEKDTSVRGSFLGDLRSLDEDKAFLMATEIVLDPREKEDMKVKALGQFRRLPKDKKTELLPVLKKTLSAASGDELRYASIRLMGMSADRQAIPVLWSVFDNTSFSQKIRFMALETIGEFRDRGQLDRLWELFQDSYENPALHKASLYAICETGGDEKHLPQLMTLLKDKDFSLPAAMILGKMGKSEALPILVEETKRTGSYSNLDKYLLEPLIAIGKPAADELSKLVDYPNMGTRLVAAKVIAKAGGREGLEKVKQLYLQCFENGMGRFFLGSYVAVLLEAGENPFPACIEWLKKANFDKESVSGAQHIFERQDDNMSHLIEILRKETDEDMAAGYVTLLLVCEQRGALEAVSEYRATVTSEKLRERIDSLVKKYAGNGKN